MGIEAGVAADRRDIDIREVTDEGLGEWSRAVSTGFLRSSDADRTEYRRTFFQPGRWLGAYDGERCVGTFRSFATELTVPGGAVLTADAISSVTVTATHRRRGLLRRMMERDLAAAVGRGEAVAILIAAEYGIYGRYGFGPATRRAGLEIDLVPVRSLRSVPGDGNGRIDLVDMADVRKLGPELFDRYRRLQPGTIERTPAWWQEATGELLPPGDEWKAPFVAVHRDTDDQVTGLLAYRIDGEWDGGRPNCTLKVTDHVATDLATAAALWRYAFSVDWVRRVEVANIAPDDPLPLLLGDPRAARATSDSADFLWLRILDLPAAFAARSYAAAERIVLQVADPAGYTDGRWVLETAADGTGRCARTDEPADLSLDTGVLASLYLGGETVPRSLSAGLVQELVPGAAARADLVLRTPLRPWCVDSF